MRLFLVRLSSISVAFAVFSLMNGCKSRSSNQNNSDLMSSTPSTSGNRQGKTGHTRVTPKTPSYEKTLAFQVWNKMNSLGASNPDLVACSDIDGVLPTRQCRSWDPSSRADFIDCFSQSEEIDGSDKWDPSKIDNIFCSFTSTQWPKLSDYLARNILVHLSESGSSLPQSVGGSKKVICSESSCQFEGFGSDVRSFVAERRIVRPQSFGTLTPPPGAVDEYGKPLPKSSKVSRVKLPAGVVEVGSWKASEGSLTAFRKWLSASDKEVFDQRLEEIEYKSKCRQEETYSLQSYSLEGYKDVNSTLRALARGEAAPSPTIAERVNVTVSAINCAKQIHAGVVIRGANLKPDQLQRYQPGSFVVEPALTSTTMGEKVLSEFRRNVAMQIFDARGADLSYLSMMADEGEGELLFQAGGLFKVLSVEKDDELTIIKMVYIP